LFTPSEGVWPRPGDAIVLGKPPLPNDAGTLPEPNGYGSTRLLSPSDGRCMPPKAPLQAGGPRGNEDRPNPNDEGDNAGATVGEDIAARQPNPCIGDVKPAGKVIGMPTRGGGDEKKSGC